MTEEGTKTDDPKKYVVHSISQSAGADVTHVDNAMPNIKRPTIVCLCGSGRFREAHTIAEFEETLSGKIVLTIGCNTHDVARSDELAKHKPMLDELHLRKIDLADEILVLDVGGYVGESTAKEIAYALRIHKRIRYLSKEAGDVMEPFYQDVEPTPDQRREVDKEARWMEAEEQVTKLSIENTELKEEIKALRGLLADAQIQADMEKAYRKDIQDEVKRMADALLSRVVDEVLCFVKNIQGKPRVEASP